ncbi:MAG: hypothetical protein ACE5GJ_04175 [Gemmatimonadota bacterium]
MRTRDLSAAILGLLLAACGGGPPSPPGLSYGVPDPPEVTYVRGDTARMDIDAGGQPMEARVTADMTVRATFARGEDGTTVTLDVQDFSARMANPAGPPVAADADGIKGPLVVKLDRRGHATVISEPTLEGPARQFFETLSMAHTFFPRLPGGAAQVGSTWSDTITYEGTQGDNDVSTALMLTYTVAGDTVVDGRSLVKITMGGTTQQSAEGIIAGMDFIQDLNGTVEGWVLWDVGRHLMVESETRGDLRGEMEVSAAPFPLGIRMRTVSRVKALER